MERLHISSFSYERRSYEPEPSQYHQRNRAGSPQCAPHSRTQSESPRLRHQDAINTSDPKSKNTKTIVANRRGASRHSRPTHLPGQSRTSPKVAFAVSSGSPVDFTAKPV